MVFKWNEQSTLLFLEHFKNYQTLWNHKLDEYKDRTLRTNAIKSLISDLNLEDTSVNTQTQNEDTTEFEPKSSQAGSEKQSTSIAENSRNGGTISSTSLHSGKPVNRKRKTDIPIDMAIKELKAISKENKEQVEDEFDLFCKSLAIQLKKMPLNRALICQERLQSVMTQERLSQMTSLSESIYSSSSTRSSLNISRSHQYDTYHSPTQQVHSPTVSVPMSSPENDQYYPSTTQQEVYSPTVSVPMSSPQNDQYYASAIQQEVHSQIVLPPSTQENILIQALKEIV
ncbi:hypothetical protein EVAR_10322_1 [Eumeta japonica]|nr:hypothetical protein EVAR_10322_1 [Eumeta japonica]